jgi:hypothetical protein
MMNGYLASQGTHVAEKRVQKALQALHFPYHTERLACVKSQCDSIFSIILWSEVAYGPKRKTCYLLCDICHCCGWLQQLHSSMARKNNLLLYDKVFRPAVLWDGMWDTVHVDHGKEFYLCLVMQETNAHKRRNTSKAPYIQSMSKENLRVERMWPEINSRVNYPLKAAICEMVEHEQIDLQDNVHKYCMSNFLIQLSAIGLERCVQSWNNHYIS